MTEVIAWRIRRPRPGGDEVVPHLGDPRARPHVDRPPAAGRERRRRRARLLAGLLEGVGVDDEGDAVAGAGESLGLLVLERTDDGDDRAPPVAATSVAASTSPSGPGREQVATTARASSASPTPRAGPAARSPRRRWRGRSRGRGPRDGWRRRPSRSPTTRGSRRRRCRRASSPGCRAGRGPCAGRAARPGAPSSGRCARSTASGCGAARRRCGTRAHRRRSRRAARAGAMRTRRPGPGAHDGRAAQGTVRGRTSTLSVPGTTTSRWAIPKASVTRTLSGPTGCRPRTWERTRYCTSRSSPGTGGRRASGAGRPGRTSPGPRRRAGRGRAAGVTQHEVDRGGVPVVTFGGSTVREVTSPKGRETSSRARRAGRAGARRPG